MYQQNYDEYSYDYTNNPRQQSFVNLVGQFHILPQSVILPNGQQLQAGTRVFIFRVAFNQMGNEVVTIVFPNVVGGNVSLGLAPVAASQLSPGGAGGGVMFPQVAPMQPGFGGR
ncbi:MULTISPECIES: hypothetical protein [Bacillus]|uniref:hypothetical protein n=1 Tax=Bacillus TaxID=1386 RepID=UPI000BF80144|nr:MULTISPECIES: hypothetical protein [Bacillus]EKS7876631.1 hypothetical protein [Bacillus cereus]KAB7649892.1 hypothetical protein GBN78_26140 [Bacillus sp. B2-WWTP-C-10-Post-4]MBK0075533.1 hypothetical protein [Bacillus sp. S56]MCU4998199.1 hypothetical protein [Bacillus cereus]MDA2452588.1 hypothetical protein [Bacillus cereus]